MACKRSINILGATGSIGESTVDVILSAPELFDVHVITAHSNADKLSFLQDKLSAKHAVLTRDAGWDDILETPVDITVSAITGFVGLAPLLKAIEHSNIVAVANKEPLVAAGDLVLEACRKYNTKLLPLDSEHNAIFQVFDFERPEGVEKIILTASGGPFRDWSLDQMRAATPAQAVAHPNWSMGQKISVDSATMMNKALEVIEAHYLFDLTPQQIDVLVHPQSVVHSMVEYKDGSVLSQMGASDMRTPIAYALGWPERITTPGQRLDLKTMRDLSFEPVDADRFPAIALAYDCIKRGQGACIALNAANEVCVEAFLGGDIGFLDILDCIVHILNGIEDREFSSLSEIQDYDQSIRALTSESIHQKYKSRTVKAS